MKSTQRDAKTTRGLGNMTYKKTGKAWVFLVLERDGSVNKIY